MRDDVEMVREKLNDAIRDRKGQPFVSLPEPQLIKMPNQLAEIANDLRPGSILTLTIQTPRES